MVVAGKRSNRLPGSLPLPVRATLACAIGFVAFIALALAAVILIAWFVHFRSLPDWLVGLFGTVIVLAIPFLVWRTVRVLTRHRYRLSLRSAMLLSAALAVALGILGSELRETARQQRAIQKLWRDGSRIQFYLSTDDSHGFHWMIRRLGYDPFAEVTEVWVRTDAGLDTLLEHRKEFSELQVLRFGPGVTDKGLECVADLNCFPDLKFVDFRNSLLTDIGIQHVSHWTNLSELTFSECTGFTDNGLTHLSDMPSLKILTFIDCSGVTDNGLTHLVDMPALEQLLFIYHPTRIKPPFTDAMMFHVGKVRDLRRLLVVGVPITDAGLEHLSGLDRLEKFTLTRAQVTKRGIEWLREVFPQCEIVSDVD